MQMFHETEVDLPDRRPESQSTIRDDIIEYDNPKLSSAPRVSSDSLKNNFNYNNKEEYLLTGNK